MTGPQAAAAAALARPRGPVPTAGLPQAVRDVVAALTSAPGAWCPALSPDGTAVAYVTDRSGTPRLEVADVGGRRTPAVLSLPDQEVISVSWSPDGAQLAYLVSPAGSIRAELHVVRPDGTGARALAGLDERAAAFAGSWAGPGAYVCSIASGRDPDADVVLVDTLSGEQRTLARGGFLTVTSVSPDGRRVLARRGPRGHRHVVLVDVATGGLTRVLAVDAPGGIASEEGRFGPDGHSVHLRASLPGRPFADRAGLVAVPLDADGRPGAGRVLLARPEADLDGYVLRPDGSLLAVWTVEGETQLAVHDGATGDLLRRVPLPEPVLSGWSTSPDGGVLVAELTGPTTPRSLWRVPLTGRSPARRIDLGLPRPGGGHGSGARGPRSRRAVLRPVRPVRYRYRASDGLPLAGWLYLPPGDPRPNRTVVSFHGGPEGQERPAWSPLSQSLVAAGFTVLAPDVRGSGGYGRAFTTCDDGAGRAASYEDVPATVAALVADGIAEPGRIGAHGWSYGGFLTLVALTRWPDLFAAGVSMAGMSDLRTFFAGTEPWMAAASVTEYGDPATEPELLAALSPLPQLDRVTAPVLLVHGDRDTNVPVGESVQAAAALAARRHPHEMLLLPGEGHTIVGHENVTELSDRVVGWFDRWL